MEMGGVTVLNILYSSHVHHKKTVFQSMCRSIPLVSSPCTLIVISTLHYQNPVRKRVAVINNMKGRNDKQVSAICAPWLHIMFFCLLD